MFYGFRGNFTQIIACCICAISTEVIASESFHDDASVCDRAATYASQQEKVPMKILKAVARTESGQTLNGELKPWPWAINIEGKGIWLSSEIEAIAIAEKQYAMNVQNFDVGCFQLNYKWHGTHFSSLKQMFDPFQNALYAAQFLKKLHSEFGSWKNAVGAYHSRNPQFAKPYLTRFNAILDVLDTTKPTGSTVEFRQNKFPLLQGTARSHARGSLFPETGHTPQHLFASTEVRG